MKVLILPSSYPNIYNPNSAPFFRDYALLLKELGHEVLVITPIPVSIKAIYASRKFDFSPKRYLDAGITTYIWCFPSIPKSRLMDNMLRGILGWYMYISAKKIFGLADIVHVHGFSAGDLARTIKTRECIPYVLTEHSTGFACNTLSLSQKWLAKRVIHDAAACTAVSSKFAELLTLKYRKPFLYIPNPVDASQLFIISDSGESRYTIRICNVAMMNKRKRQDRLIRAFFNLSKKYPNAELHLIGDGPEMKNLQKLCVELGIQEKVRFYGALPRENVLNIMKASDIFALSSEYETFGVVIIEAMFCGLPVVSTKCVGPESIITDSSLGLLTENTDTDFDNGLLQVVQSWSNQKYDKNTISTHMKNHYSFDVIGKLLTSLYEKTLNKGTTHGLSHGVWND